jgi:hypothetical protein
MPASFFPSFIVNLVAALPAFLVALAALARLTSMTGMTAPMVESQPCDADLRILPTPGRTALLAELHLGPTLAPIPPAACVAACQRCSIPSPNSSRISWLWVLA